MIQINLLPPEYRKTESTPIARFLTIVVGAILVTSGLVSYGYIHYSKLNGIREVRASVEEEFANKTAQAKISKNLENEINAFETRRRAIQQVAGSRILQSRKLDEFLDVIHNGGDRTAYYVWLRNLAVSPPRRTRRGQSATGGTWSFSGYAETTEFSRVTNLRDSLRKDEFYEDFASISLPIFKAELWDDGLEPTSAGSFNYSMSLKPLGWRRATPKAASARRGRK